MKRAEVISLLKLLVDDQLAMAAMFEEGSDEHGETVEFAKDLNDIVGKWGPRS